MHDKIRRYFRHGTLTQLRVLDALARLGNFTRAGEELHMAQPTVSVHMKKLAETIGVPLVEHRDKRVKLTAAGEKVHAAYARILETLRDLDAGLLEIDRREQRDPDAAARTSPANALPLRRASCFRAACRLPRTRERS